MSDRWSDYASLFVAALELGHPFTRSTGAGGSDMKSFMCSTRMTRVSRQRLRTWSRAVTFSPTPGTGGSKSLINPTRRARRISRIVGLLEKTPRA